MAVTETETASKEPAGGSLTDREEFTCLLAFSLQCVTLAEVHLAVQLASLGKWGLKTCLLFRLVGMEMRKCPGCCTTISIY